MIVYQAVKSGFLDDHDNREIDEVIAAKYVQHVGRYANEAEVRSWRASLGEMARVLRDPDIPDNAGVGIEFGIPQSSKRIDFILSGTSEDKRANLIIVELKQWSEAKLSLQDGIIIARRGGPAEREGTHPSYQAWSYAALLEGFNETVYERPVALSPCAYLHNYRRDGVIDHEHYREYIEKAPLFLKGEAELQRLRDFIKHHIRRGDDGVLPRSCGHFKEAPS